MSKGKRMTQFEKDRIKSAQAKLANQKKPTPIIKGGFDKGILTFNGTDPYKAVDFSKVSNGGYQAIQPRQSGKSIAQLEMLKRGIGTGWDIEQLKKLMDVDKTKNIFFDEYGNFEQAKEPEDKRTPTEKWADEWTEKNGGSNRPVHEGETQANA